MAHMLDMGKRCSPRSHGVTHLVQDPSGARAQLPKVSKTLSASTRVWGWLANRCDSPLLQPSLQNAPCNCWRLHSTTPKIIHKPYMCTDARLFCHQAHPATPLGFY